MSHIPLLSIRCAVYNHEPYLRQCLDGFVMQRTNFPFEAIIHDDASTDGSTAIIREYAEKYPDIIKPVYETENQYSKRDGSLKRAIDAAMHPMSKYVAVCEGDDYWTDPNKLQQQVDVLENDLGVGIVHSCAVSYDHATQRIVDEKLGHEVKSFEDLLMDNGIITLTVCYRRPVLNRYEEFYQSNNLAQRGWKMGDYPLWLYICHQSRAHFLPQTTGVYRLLQNSASHSTDVKKKVAFELSVLDIRAYFARLYHREDLLDKIALQAEKNLQWISLSEDQTLDYDLTKLMGTHDLKLPFKLRVRHQLLKSSLARKGLIRLLKWRNG